MARPAHHAMHAMIAPSCCVLCLAGPATVDLQAPLGRVPLLYRAGSILPMQQPGATTDAVARSPLSLLVLLLPDEEAPAVQHCGAATDGGPRRDPSSPTTTASAQALDGAMPCREPAQATADGWLYMDDGEQAEVGGAGSVLMRLSAAGATSAAGGGTGHVMSTVQGASPIGAAGTASAGGAAQDVLSVRIASVSVLGLQLKDGGAGLAVSLNGVRLRDDQVQLAQYMQHRPGCDCTNGTRHAARCVRMQRDAEAARMHAGPGAQSADAHARSTCGGAGTARMRMRMDVSGLTQLAREAFQLTWLQLAAPAQANRGEGVPPGAAATAVL